jgi:predicted NUDIX family NTP pyrophosphohydrolase
MREFPETDRAEWFDASDAKKKILKGQAGFIDRLMKAIDYAQEEADNGIPV